MGRGLHGFIGAGLVLTLALAACGDDAGVDQHAPLRDGGGGDARLPSGGPRRDAGSQSDAGGQGDEDAGEPAVLCAQGSCDPRDARACGSGEGCVLDLDSAEAMCAPVGDGDDGAPCTSQRDCGPGLDCNARDGAGVCRHYCCERTRGSDCPALQYCGLGLLAQSGTPTDVFLCEACEGCDLRDADACGAGLGCYPVPSRETCRACLPAGKAGRGQSCSATTDCAPGTGCVRLLDRERCTPFCDLAATGPCSDGLRCQPLGTQLPAGVGVCL